MTPLETALSVLLVNSRNNLPIVDFSPAAIESRNFLSEVRTDPRAEPLRADRFTACLARFSADLCVAKVNTSKKIQS